MVALSDKTLMAYDQHVLGYMPKPLTATIVQSLLTEIIIQKEKEDIIVNTSNGYEKINIADINYVDIIKRNICYHLTSNIDVISVTIRKAFNNYVASLISNKNFVYVAPAFLINLSQIAQLSSDHVTFKNGAIVYVNKKQYTEIYSAWSK